MKHLRIFNNDSEYQTFISGADYVTPNICLNKETFKIKLEPATIAGLIFPVYLDNNDYELGAEVYNYLYNKYNVINYIDIDEEIYVKCNGKWARLQYLCQISENHLTFTMVGYNYIKCHISPSGTYGISNTGGGSDA